MSVPAAFRAECLAAINRAPVPIAWPPCPFPMYVYLLYWHRQTVKLDANMLYFICHTEDEIVDFAWSEYLAVN